jgi:phage gp46-like protein
MTDIRVVNIRASDGTGRDLEGNTVSLHAIWMDWLLKPDNTLDETEELVNIVKVALLTHGLVDSDDVLPDPDSTDRRGWWGDMDAESIWDGWPIGAKIWLLSRAKITPAEAREGPTLVRAEEYCRIALQPMIDRRICSRVDVEATKGSDERINVMVRVYRGPLPQIELRFNYLWDEIGVT